ncbi:MAG: response regulator transcription factor [Deltaproteobacteria bacterium]|nr:response regulator transcription factor [Deltaproteobacteria bacterium]
MARKNESTVFIVDDHDVVVQGIQSALRGHPEFKVAGAAADGATAVEQAGTLKPDILILDVSMPGMNGVETAYRIREISPDTRLVIFSMHAEPEFVLSLFRAGISGYVLKDESLTALMDALEIVRNGGTSYSSTVNRLLHEHMLELELGVGKEAREMQDGIARLSAREKEIFPLLADGMSVKEIADRLCISPKTVESHKYNIFDKLKARSIADLTKLGIRKGLVKA